MEDSKEYKELLDGINQIAEQMKGLCEQAYYVYKPQVDDICSRNASQNEVGLLLDWLLQYAGDDRMLGLYKQVCRAYWQKYPESISFYVLEYLKWYEPEKLKGTEWEYLLEEDKDLYDDLAEGQDTGNP